MEAGTVLMQAACWASGSVLASAPWALGMTSPRRQALSRRVAPRATPVNAKRVRCVVCMKCSCSVLDGVHATVRAAGFDAHRRPVQRREVPRLGLLVADLLEQRLDAAVQP